MTHHTHHTFTNYGDRDIAQHKAERARMKKLLRGRYVYTVLRSGFVEVRVSQKQALAEFDMSRCITFAEREDGALLIA